MAENQILVKFKPSGHEELIKAINRLSTVQKKLTDSVKKVDTASSKAAKSAGVLGTRNQRLTETNSKLANSFATIRSKMLLVSFAMSLGIRQIAQMAREAANLKGMETAFNTLAGGTENATVAIDKLRGATNNTMSDFDLFQQANNAMILGVSKNSDEMAEMFDIAQRLGNALGKDTRMSVESLITGIGRQSRLMLDNIGIIVKSEEAYESYAQTLGKNKDELTDSEKKQAFLTATMESARQKVSTLNEETNTTRTSFQQLDAAAENLQGRIGDAANAFKPLIDNTTKFVDLITDERIDRFIRTFKLLGEVILKVGGFVVAAGLLFTSFSEILAGVGVVLAAIYSSWLLLGGAIIASTFAFLTGKDALEGYLDPLKKLSEEERRLQILFEAGATTLVDQYTPAVESHVEAIEDTTNAMLAQRAEIEMLNELYGQTKEGRIDAIDAQLATIDAIATELGMTEKLAAVYAMLIDKKAKLNKVEVKGNKEKRTEIQLITERAIKSANANEHIGASAVKTAGAVLKARLAVAVADLMEDAFAKLGWLGIPLAASAGAVVGSIFQGGVNTLAGGLENFEQGGVVGGRRHSQGGTMIEAERGEFVMSRNAVDAIGVENLNRMNQGGGGAVNVTFTGNVMSQDFIENEAIPQIKDAIRRGADIGVS